MRLILILILVSPFYAFAEARQCSQLFRDSTVVQQSYAQMGKLGNQHKTWLLDTWYSVNSRYFEGPPHLEILKTPEMIHIVDEMRVLVQRRMHQASQIIQNSSRDKASYESYKELEKSILRDFDHIVQNGVPYVALIKSSEKLAIFLTLTSDMESGSFPWSYDKILYARFTGAWKLSTALDMRLQEDGVMGLLVPTTKELDIKDFNSVAHLPISYLGLIFRSEKTDGRYMSPIEFFEHDLAHASINSVFRHDRDKSYNMFMQLNEKIKNQDPAVTNILQRIENAPTQSIVNSGRLLFFRHAHEFGQQDFSTEAFKKSLSRGNLSTLYSLLKRGFYGAPENLGINSFKDLQAAAKLITEQ